MPFPPVRGILIAGEEGTVKPERTGGTEKTKLKTTKLIMKTEKRYRVTKTRYNRGGQEPSKYVSEGTLLELIPKFSYTLEVGASYSHEKGNAKINRNPKTIDQLIKNLNNAVNNAAANGYSGSSYAAEIITEPVPAAPRTASDFPVAESVAGSQAIMEKFNA